MHEINEEIISALNRLIEFCGSALEVERRTGVTNSTISKYRSGRIPRMNSSTWAALEPHLRPFMKHAAAPAAPPGNEIGPKLPMPPGYLNLVVRHIMDSPELTEAERIKFIRVLLKLPFSGQETASNNS